MNYIITRTITDVHGCHGELYYHTDNHGCPRMTRRIILSHGQSRMSTDDTENIITCTIADVHGCHGEYYHMYNRGCPRTIRRIILSHGQSRMSTDDMGNYYMIHVSQVICLCYVLSSFCFTVQYKGFHDLVAYFFYGFSTIDGK